MDETNLTPRQKKILNRISQSAGIIREDIKKSITAIYTVSKPTLIRDLHVLVENKLIRVTGKGKNTVYAPYAQNPLLRFVDLDTYFQSDPDQRPGAKKQFDFQVFDHLTNLIHGTDLEDVRAVAKNFSRQTKLLTPDIVQRELERFVIELSWKSSKLEGNTYTLLETERLIRESKEASGRTKDESVMILNHKTALEQILTNKNDFKTLSISLIHQLHNCLVSGLHIKPGIRKQAVGITGTVYQPLGNQHQLTEAMEKCVDAINANPSTTQKALIALSMISYIQPYADGNKRTARMLTNAILLAHDYYPLSYRSVNEEKYKQALILFYEQGSLFHVKRLLLDQMKFAFTTYFQ